MAISTVFTTAATFSTHLSSTHPRFPFPPSPSFTRSFRIRRITATSGNSKDHNSGKTVSSAKSKTKHTLQIVGPDTTWEVEEDEDAMYARCDMPGLSKAGLKLTVENNKILITGEEVDRDTTFYKEKEKPRKYDGYITFPENLKMEQMEADIKNGVLLVVVPKLKPEEKKGVFFVKIN